MYPEPDEHSMWDFFKSDCWESAQTIWQFFHAVICGMHLSAILSWFL